MELIQAVEKYAAAMKLAEKFGNKHGDIDAANTAWRECKKASEESNKHREHMEILRDSAKDVIAWRDETGSGGSLYCIDRLRHAIAITSNSVGEIKMNIDDYVPVDTPQPPPPQPGTWILTSPDGKVYEAESPLRCAAMEQQERIPENVALERIYAAMADVTEQHLLEQAEKDKAELVVTLKSVLPCFPAGRYSGSKDAVRSAIAKYEVKK